MLFALSPLGRIFGLHLGLVVVVVCVDNAVIVFCIVLSIFIGICGLWVQPVFPSTIKLFNFCMTPCTPTGYLGGQEEMKYGCDLYKF